MTPASDAWPAMPLDSWRDTCDTLHLYLQIPGKIRLALAPHEPQWGHVTLFVTARGLTTGPMPYEDRQVEITFDFIWQKVVIAASDGKAAFVDLEPRSVAAFYADMMKALRDCGVDVKISDVPQEVPDPIPFARDETHKAYDRAAIARFWRVLTSIDMVFTAHRAPFKGRHTPVQMWWGSFDLGYTRFNGRPMPPPPGANLLVREGMGAEEINAGFWPGDARFPEAAFFSYTLPKPDGIDAASIKPKEAFWSKELGEFLLRYEDVRRAPSPRQALLDFLSSTYDAGAALNKWDPALKGN